MRIDTLLSSGTVTGCCCYNIYWNIHIHNPTCAYHNKFSLSIMLPEIADAKVKISFFFVFFVVFLSHNATFQHKV